MYNGWTNYETWAVNLWLTNDEGTSNFWNKQAEELFCPDEDNRPAVRKLANRLKDEHENALPEVEGFAADLLNAAMSEVNWHEIAESLLEDAKERLEA